MIKNFMQRFCITEHRFLLLRNKSASANIAEYDIEEIEDTTESIEDSKQQEELIEKKRNKSRLNSNHYNILHEKVPYSKPIASFHTSVNYNRKIYGTYGESSGVDAKICWPTNRDIESIKEYEKIAYPYTINQIIQENVQRKKETEEEQRKRQENIVKKFAKLEQWKKELRDKVAKREMEAKAVKERKDRLVEEVRRHFGFKIDPRDERFKEMLEQKERAEKKSMKEAKRKVKEARLIAKLQETKIPEAAEKSKPTEDS